MNFAEWQAENTRLENEGFVIVTEYLGDYVPGRAPRPCRKYAKRGEEIIPRPWPLKDLP